ncbi:glutamine--fructose-6-phosphate transaminase (isomerizing) [Thiomicrospira microaerophila]|uniref:glutamine--fructose-6-phosphate transaminase (isomerizing) n=1 Tax=Thiomicrospira microaerophila TaxID=406020 RepID=UPI00200CC5E5
MVHNGIIENYQQLKAEQTEKGFRFTSETDTEVIAHAIYEQLYNQGVTNPTSTDLLNAVQRVTHEIKGAYALGIICRDLPDTLIAVRKGSPLVIGVGFGEHFIASDISALLPVTQRFIYLEEGDVACLDRQQYQIYNAQAQAVEREVILSSQMSSASDLAGHRHFMHKEIYEQPQAVINTLSSRITNEEVDPAIFGAPAQACFETINRLQIVACGTSYHAGLVAKYWIEDIIGLPCQVEVASEYRYRNPVLQNNTLLVTLSQSGETADTLAALQQIKQIRKNNSSLNIPTLTICNVAESSLTRESDLVFLTHAGPEIGVASTKAFTTQLVGLALLMTAIGKVKGSLNAERQALIVQGLLKLPGLLENALSHEADIKLLAQGFADKHHAIFLGRGPMYPIAMEGALKLKEISYIHAEAYPAGELKHGPLALIDETMPVIAIAPHDELLEKLKSNLQEVSARGGQMIVFEDEASNISSEEGFKVIKASSNVGRITAPITFNIALQLLSYHVALIKGTDVDRPRNLAKSVTVE